MSDFPAPNARAALLERVTAQRTTWRAASIMLFARTGLIILAQSVAAAYFWWRGAPSPWNAAAPWWSVYGTSVDIGCLLLLWHFTRREDIAISDLIGKLRLRYGRDFFVTLGCLVVVAAAFVIPARYITPLIYSSGSPPTYPGLLTARALPLWGIIYSFSIYLLLWSPTEEIMYNGYVLARFDALFGRRWPAVLVVAAIWAFQHVFLPFVPDWKYVLWRFAVFLPGCLCLALLYLLLRRLPPLFGVHWLMDIFAQVSTLKL